MSGRKYRRYKLRAHDLGIDRHSKGVAFERKAARLAKSHEALKQSKRKRSKQHSSRATPESYEAWLLNAARLGLA